MALDVLPTLLATASLPAAGSPDHGPVAIRPAAPRDVRELERFYAGLSPESRQRRFFAAVPGVSHTTSVAFCTADHRRREGFVATTVVDNVERIVAHLCLEPVDERTDEIALVVADRWQEQGIGRRLAAAAVDWASRAGVERLTATILAGNAPIRRLLTGLGLPFETRRVGLDVEEIEIRLAPPVAHAA
jgi:acetyltransferase